MSPRLHRPIPAAGVGRDVGRGMALAVDAAGKDAIGIESAEPIARRVAIAAAADRGDEIGAPVPHRALARIRPPGTGKIHGEDRNRAAGRGEGLGSDRPVDPRHRRQAVEKRLQIGEVARLEAVVERERKGRQVARIIGGDAPAHRLGEVARAPPADPGATIGGDVGGDDGAELGLEHAPAGIGRTAVGGVA